MRRLGLALLAWASLTGSVWAQNFTMPPPAGVVLNGVVVVASCGNQSLSTGLGYLTMDETGTLCTAGGGSGGTSYTVNYGSANSTKGTPSGFNDASGNFQPLLGDTTNGQWVNVKASVLPTGAATSVNQSGTSATTAHGCAIAGYGEIGCLGQIDDDIKSPVPLGTAGGITPLKLNALTNGAIAIKASAGQLFLLQCGNTNASEAYVQVYNVASGSVSVGTTAPTISIPIAATSTGGFALSLQGLQFGTAISAAATTTATGGTGPGTALDCNAGYN